MGHEAGMVGVGSAAIPSLATPAHDPRAVANLLLDLADSLDIAVSHIALQKLLYFAHADYLLRTGRPLLSGYFEAWTHGPVHPLVYASFKHSGAAPITHRATRTDYASGKSHPVEPPDDREARFRVEQTLRHLGRLSASQLVSLSHAPDGPWDWVKRNLGTGASVGARISDTVTRERFRHLIVSLGTGDRHADAREDTPLA